MNASQPTVSGEPIEHAEGPAGENGPPEVPGTRLRGASVGVDARRVGRVLAFAFLVSLLVLVVALFLAGADRNAQINQLREHGVAVKFTVTGCLGLLGGSGSNEAGYACRGTYSIDGHRYDEAIPGNTLHVPGSTLRAVAVPGDPGLVSTVIALKSERASWRVFLLPIVLSVVLGALVGAVFLRRRSARAHVVR